jgi:hypothetical protein
MAERNKVLSKTYNETNEAVDGIPARSIQIKFLASGNVLTGSLDSLKPEIVTQAALHGINQKLGDAAAGKQGDEAEEAVMSVWEQIVGGNWNAKAEPGEGRPSFVAEAVFELKQEAGKLAEGETLETYTARYAGKDGAEARKKAMAVPAVAARVLQKQIAAKQAALAKLQEQPADLSAI